MFGFRQNFFLGRIKLLTGTSCNTGEVSVVACPSSPVTYILGSWVVNNIGII